MGRKAIQLRLEPAKGIPTAHVLTDKFKSTLKQLKNQIHFCAFLGQNGNVLGKNLGEHKKNPPSRERRMGGRKVKHEISKREVIIDKYHIIAILKEHVIAI